MHLVSSPIKKKKKTATTTTSVIPKNGTIDRFFKKTNPISSITDVKPVEINSQESSLPIKSSATEVNCPNCQILLPKANLFIHQIRCSK